MITIANKKQSYDGSAKYLFQFADGSVAETITFKFNNSNAACVSTQIGCNTGCAFCASHNYKFVRNLTDAEIIEEVKTALKQNPDIAHFDEVAFQGTGEPLLNLENISKAAAALKSDGYAIDFSLATSGVLSKFPQIADTPINTVYLSLHATDDATRTKLIPTNIATGINKLIEAAEALAVKTKTKIWINYLLLDGVNDRPGDLDRLISFLNPDHFRIQLAKINQIEQSRLQESTKFGLFAQELKKHGFTVRILESCGRDIDGGCGQMISKHLTKTQDPN